MVKSDRFLFLKKYLHTDNRELGKLIDKQIYIVKDKIYVQELVREDRQLTGKAELIRQASDKRLFDAPRQLEILFELVRSLGTDYGRGVLRYSNSHRHQVKLNLGQIPLPKQIDFYASPGFIRENEKILDGLLNDRAEKEMRPSPTTIFLPLMFPNLYGAMAQKYRQRFERLSLKAYHKYAERRQVSIEKSPKDYIKFFNQKGFKFEKREGKLYIGSIYSKYPVSVPIAPKTQAYLESSTDLNRVLGEQTRVLENIETSGRANLKSLWAGHLVETGQYKKAAYLFVLHGVRPNLPLQQLEHHMQNGLKQALGSVSQKQVDRKQARLLRKGVYALGNMLASNSYIEEEMFNGFKDELTDYSKYKGRGLWM